MYLLTVRNLTDSETNEFIDNLAHCLEYLETANPESLTKFSPRSLAEKLCCVPELLDKTFSGIYLVEGNHAKKLEDRTDTWRERIKIDEERFGHIVLPSPKTHDEEIRLVTQPLSLLKIRTNGEMHNGVRVHYDSSGKSGDLLVYVTPSRVFRIPQFNILEFPAAV